jgi:hypothetical protein
MAQSDAQEPMPDAEALMHLAFRAMEQDRHDDAHRMHARH